MRLPQNPALARCTPFGLFILMLVLGSALPPGQHEWLVLGRAALAAAALVFFWRAYGELRRPPAVQPGHWAAAAVAGLAVFLAWIGLDHPWAVLPHAPGLDPRLPGGGMDWLFVAGRLAGLVLVVPVMEELFWRSFLLRWLRRHDFLALAPRQAGMRAFLATTVLFALEHDHWLAGGLAGMAYNALYMLSGNLWVPILAHALTNAALGAWILHTHAWSLW